jgi:hypothetical protein
MDSKDKNKKRPYEPPTIYELDVDMTQAMGQTNCSNGNRAAGLCLTGNRAGNPDCTFGNRASVTCGRGNSPGWNCSTGNSPNI